MDIYFTHYLDLFFKWFYSLDIHPFTFASAPKGDCSICMDWHIYSGEFEIPGFCFAKDTILLYKYVLTNFVIIINPAFVFSSSVKIS